MMRAKKGCETRPEPAGEMKFARRASPAAVLAVFENKNYVYFRRGVGNYAQPAHVGGMAMRHYVTKYVAL